MNEIQLDYLKHYAHSTFAVAGGFFELPTWYKYLPVPPSTPQVLSPGPTLNSITDIWLIAAAVFEMLLYLAGLVAVMYFIYSGFVFMTSQGNPERVTAGRKGLINAVVGLVIAILAANIVTLVVKLV